MKNLKWVLIALAVAALVFLKFSGMYNQLVSEDEGVKSAWAQVENVYQRRMDLIPNLVSSVKGYVQHEEKTLLGVTEARAKISQMKISSDIVNDPAMLEKFQQAQSQLSSSLSRLLVVAEKYPDLKADQQFFQLNAELAGTENRIAVERKRFNEAAQQFNTTIRLFPKNIVANLGGFKAKAYFKADEGAMKAPTVDFTK